MTFREYVINMNDETYAGGETLLSDGMEIFDEWLTSNGYEADEFTENENGNLTTVVDNKVFELILL